MASTAHGVLTAGQTTSIDINAGREGIVIVNRAQQGVIWVRIDGEDPEPEGDDTYAVFGVREFPLTRRQALNPITVKMLSEADRAYTVEAY